MRLLDTVGRFAGAPTLLVIGAALGSGRWLTEHVLGLGTWEAVYLVDSDRSITSLEDINWPFERAPQFGRSTASIEGLQFASGAKQRPDQLDEPLVVHGTEVVLCLAVPPSALLSVLEAVKKLELPLASVIVSSLGMEHSLGIVRAVLGPDVAAIGVHALNDGTAPNALGQIVYVVGEPGSTITRSTTKLVVRSGAIPKLGTAREHDHTMSVVQALTHRTLIAFADAVERSGLNLEADLWEARTPLFETLLGLSVRVLDTRQQATIGVAQEALADRVVNRGLDDALRRLDAETPTAASVVDWIQDVRGGFSGSFFDSLRAVAANTVNATQLKRSEVARRARNDALVGVMSSETHRVHVGRIADYTATTITIEELLVGADGKSALLLGEGRDNARRLGVQERTVRTIFSLGNVSLLSEAELEEVLDRRLGRIQRDLRVLVPESVSGDGVLLVIRELDVVSHAELIDEVVRTGQRSVVIRIRIRSDRPVDQTIDAVLEHVASVYRWPRVTTRSVNSATLPRIAYLGPAGTFSESAALQLAEIVGPGCVVEDLAGFEDVLAAVSKGNLGVLPLSSSSSGLVTRAVKAILATDFEIVAGGVIDVPVRFDAYAKREYGAEALRGAVVYSHPQALAQCGSFVRRLGLQPVETSSTVASLEQVAEASGPAVALAGAGNGTEFGLRVLEREVDDIAGSITRFLVLAREGIFGELEGGSAPTLRTVWVGSDIRMIPEAITQLGAGFDELLSDDGGNFALISSRDPKQSVSSRNLRFLGSVPWSPRTPIVRPAI